MPIWKKQENLIMWNNLNIKQAIIKHAAQRKLQLFDTLVLKCVVLQPSCICLFMISPWYVYTKCMYCALQYLNFHQETAIASCSYYFPWCQSSLSCQSGVWPLIFIVHLLNLVRCSVLEENCQLETVCFPCPVNPFCKLPHFNTLNKIKVSLTSLL